MNRNRVRNFLLALTIGAIAAAPAEAPRADDTEIYLGTEELSEGIRPRVLFILDTSGSMSEYDGYADNRLDRMKQALHLILDNADNIDVGLMRFSDPGGPILFPVSYIDADADAIESAGQPDVSVRVSDPDDDAEMLSGVVKLDSYQLEMLDTPAFGSELNFTVQIAQGADDAEEAVNDGTNRGHTGTFNFYNNDSDTLETVLRNGARRTVGLRFQDFPADTAGAAVLHADVSLRSQEDLAGDLTVQFWGHDVDDSQEFPAAHTSTCPNPNAGENDIFCRWDNRKTTATTFWDVPAMEFRERYRSTDLSPILQEIFDRAGWQTADATKPDGRNDDLSIFYSSEDDPYRRISSYDDRRSSSAILSVDYVAAPFTSGTQVVGLRFRNVSVPQGMDIESAYIELTPYSDSSDAVDMIIYGQVVPDAPAFTTTANDLNRTPLSAGVPWNVAAGEVWAQDNPVQTPDLGGIVQEIVDQSGPTGWCGGNDMVFLFKTNGATATRIVQAYENDPSRAPVLRINYDDDTPLGAGEGCISQTVVRQIASSKDDAEERLDTDAVSVTSTELQMVEIDASRRQEIGLRFQNVPIPNSAEILSAELEVQAADPYSAGTATWNIEAQLVPNADEFLASSSNLTQRTPRTATETYSMPLAAVSRNERFRTPDIKAIIQEVVDQGGWEAGNDLALHIDGTGRINVRSFDDNPARAASLFITYRYNMGDVPPGEAVVPKSVRARLKEIVDDLTANGYTPIVDTLHEGAKYYRGEEVDWGRTRGNGGTSVQRETRVSHPGSYTGGSVSRAIGCTDLNLNDDACRSEEITGTPVYTSPITQSCQTNYIVLLTDGFANHNHSVSRIESMTNKASCYTTLSNGDTVAGGEECGVDLVEFLANNDQSDSVDGDNTVVTYTIGFNISTQFLKDLANKGKGGFYMAASAEELASVFQTIIAEVLAQTTSFATPSLSVNAFNRLFHRNEVYFSLFEPTNLVRWNGNVKKYQLRETCVGVPGDCQVGEVLDARPDGIDGDAGEPAIGADERIRETALSFWGDPGDPDGDEILKGGAGAVQRGQGFRKVYTLLSGAPSNTYLGSNEVVDDDANGIIDDIPGATEDEQLQNTKDLLGFPGDDVSTIRANPDTVQAQADIDQLKADLAEHIAWLQGVDVDDEDGDATTLFRYTYTDPLHSSPVAVTFSSEIKVDDPDTEVDERDLRPIIKFFVGTNDGGLRMVNGYNGKEEWIFYPQATLPQQVQLRTNPQGDHLYGLDGTPTAWINDENENGIIEPDVDVNGDGIGEFVRLYIGMRRGGRFLYALDVSPSKSEHQPDGLDSRTSTDDIVPTYMWRIEGGTGDFPQLGETWSRPRVARLRKGVGGTANQSTTVNALLFAGGYEAGTQDGAFVTGNSGNAIYAVDAVTGAREFWISQDADPNITGHDPSTSEGVEVPGMYYPIPSDLAIMDSDSDGAVDRLYVGDTGGQLWRVDIFPDLTVNAGYDLVVGRLGTVSFFKDEDPSTANPDPLDRRKFFYPPDVVQVRAGVGVSVDDNYDLVTIVSGTRSSPLDQSVQDRFFAFRDRTITRMADDTSLGGTAGDGIASGMTVGTGDAVSLTIQGAIETSPGTDGELYDVTTENDPTGSADAETFLGADGYYIDFGLDGEKGLAPPVILAGKLFFTTYLPEGVVQGSTCSLAEGSGLLYGLDVLTGAAIFNWSSEEGEPTTIADRSMPLGSGIPSAAVPVFQPEAVTLLIGGGGGATVVDPNIVLPRARTYWFQELPK